MRVYATTNLNFPSLDQAYQTILNDLPSQPALHQVSLSYGLGETYESLAQKPNTLPVWRLTVLLFWFPPATEVPPPG